MSSSKKHARRGLGRGPCAALLLALAVACGDEGPQTEGETHFLRTCDSTCAKGLSCICGACTKPCEAESACVSLAEDATCEATPAACGSGTANACDMACTASAECKVLGAAYVCANGRCRVAPNAVGDGGRGGGSGQSGGRGGQSGGAGSAGSSAGGSGGGSEADAGVAGSGGAGGVGDAGEGGTGGAGDGGTSDSCDEVGAPCCDPFPGDGPNYCNAGLTCGGDQCLDCQCLVGAYVPLCGQDGVTYDAACGRACVTAPIACDGQCPCKCVTELATGCASTEPGGGQACCSGLMCCEGVPYDPTGECRTSCPFISDRNLKTDVHAANTQAVLESVARLPISSWRYRSSPEALHVGPMAQDFAAELGLGADEHVIEPVDASGTSLAAIQALYARVQALAERNAVLERRITELEKRRR